MSSIEHERAAKILTSTDHLAEPFRATLEREVPNASTDRFVLYDAPMYENVRGIDPPSTLTVTNSAWLHLLENLKTRTVTVVRSDLANLLYVEIGVVDLRGTFSLCYVEDGRISSHTFAFSSAQTPLYLIAARIILSGSGKIPSDDAPMPGDRSMLESFPATNREIVLEVIAPGEKLVTACWWPPGTAAGGALALADRTLVITTEIQAKRTMWFTREKGGGWKSIVCPRGRLIRYDSANTPTGSRVNLTLGIGATTTAVTADYPRESERSVMGLLQQALPATTPAAGTTRSGREGVTL